MRLFFPNRMQNATMRFAEYTRLHARFYSKSHESFVLQINEVTTCIHPIKNDAFIFYCKSALQFTDCICMSNNLNS